MYEKRKRNVGLYTGQENKKRNLKQEEGIA